ncbi:hypothetical protein EYD45_13170 [Hyunsoonleella flava]|uniref:Uncharacterized protein n=1 Tax=Hyunsoonleella flava TaxID=2527939 RepID=A0A4Q9FCH4_9FLAO|nr:hypothetical protein [Hyunsoonleella flava]TBN01351.1 hypothetical protein EYD45_13170 [Hyunsoonleella flava]
MKFSRLFYDSRVSFTKISINWIIISVVIGLLSALTIYNFFYVIRESFRVMTFGFANLPYVLTEEDRNSYNLFFAGLSVVFANSITINMLLSRPSGILYWRNPIRRRILNDQVFLNFNFSYWFTKMGLCFFIFSMCCLDFDFSPYVGVLSSLLLLVLYLDSWKGLSRIFRKNRFKFQIIHFTVLILLTFGLSKINTIDYQSIDDTAIKSSPIYQLPYSNFYHEFHSAYHREVVLTLELEDDNELLILYQGKRAVVNDIPDIIAAERASLREEMVPFLHVRIIADKALNIEYIKQVEKILYTIAQLYVVYDVYNDDLLTHRFERRGIKFKITPTIIELQSNIDIQTPPLPEWWYFDRSKNLMSIIKVDIGSVIKVNGIITPKEILVEEFKKYILKNILFEYSYEKNTSYQDYINVLSSQYKAAFELRKQNQTIFKEHSYNDREAYLEEQNKLKQQFPIRIIETFD